MSIIQQPVTANYIYQTLITLLSKDKSILSNGVTPITDIFLQYKNNNFEVLKGNGYKYTFVYNFELNDFLNPSTESIKRAQVISHEQMTTNFGANLMYFSGYQYYTNKVVRPFKKAYSQLMRKDVYNTVTIDYLYNLPNVYSKQYGTNGITLKDYMQTVITALPGIVAECPVDLNKVQDYFPENYVTSYTYTDLQGNTTTKTASFTAIKYTQNGSKKVLFLGTGLQEFVVD